MSNLFLEKNSCAVGVTSQDVNGGVSGARISLAEGYKLACIVRFETSLATAFSVSLQQHDAAAGGNSKALEVKTNYYHKADGSAFTKVEVRSDDSPLSATADLAAQATAAGYAVIEVLPEHLDVDGGFDHISMDITADAAKVASVTYVVRDIQNGYGYEKAL